jgi:hypothetical protein
VTDSPPFFSAKGVSDRPAINISQVMPPENRAAADQFCRQLIMIIRGNFYSSLDGVEFALPNSIIEASKLSAQFSVLIPLIPRLLGVPEIRDEFESNIGDLLIATGFDSGLLHRLFEIFGPKKVIASFNQIAKTNPEAAETFFKAIGDEGVSTNAEAPPPVKRESKFQIRDFIINRGDVRELDRPTQIPRHMKAIQELLASPETADRALSFVIDVCECFPKIDFSQIIPRLLAFLGTRNGKFTAKAFRCTKLVVTKLDDVVPFLAAGETADVALTILNMFIQKAADDQISDTVFEHIDTIVRKMESESLPVRRTATMIMTRLARIREEMIRDKVAQLAQVSQRMFQHCRGDQAPPDSS